MSNRLSRWGRVVATLATSSLVAALMVGVTAPAQAALYPTCGIGLTNPWTDGSTAFGRASVSCSTPNAVRAGARLDRQGQVGTWPLSTAWFYGATSPGTTSISSGTAQHNCNGTGTRTYRTVGWGNTSGERTDTRVGAGVSIVC